MRNIAVNSRDDDYQGVPQGGEFPEPSEEIIGLYKKHIPEYLKEFLDAVEAQDQEAVMFHCHKMSSAVKTMGFDNIGELLEAVQREKPSGQSLVEISERVQTLIQHTLVLLDK